MTSWVSELLWISDCYLAFLNRNVKVVILCLPPLYSVCCVCDEISFFFTLYVFRIRRMVLKGCIWGNALEKPHPHLDIMWETVFWTSRLRLLLWDEIEASGKEVNIFCIWEGCELLCQMKVVANCKFQRLLKKYLLSYTLSLKLTILPLEEESVAFPCICAGFVICLTTRIWWKECSVSFQVRYKNATHYSFVILEC